MDIERCPSCGSVGTARLFQKRLDFYGESVELFICSSCTAIINRTNLIKEQADAYGARQEQIDSADWFYSEEIDKGRLSENVNNIAFLNNLIGNIIGGASVVDLGAGEGYLAAAACSFYDQSWAIDINVDLLNKTIPQFEMGDKVKVGASLDDVPGEVDAIFMWHTLEHIPDAHALGKDIAAKLKEEGLFIWQVPAYRDPYVVFSHYTFFNDYAARVFTETIGLEVVNVFHDEALQFLTVVSRKPKPELIEEIEEVVVAPPQKKPFLKRLWPLPTSRQSALR